MSSGREGADVLARCNCHKCCGSPAALRSFYCTACGKKTFTAAHVREHPTLHGVGVCIGCYTFLVSSPFTKDVVDIMEEQCRWCGQGGSITMCGRCNKVFCESCIVRNYGDAHGLSLILKMKDWQCFCCSPALLAVHVDELKAFTEAKTREARHAHLQAERENAAQLLLAQERRKERQNRDKEIHMSSQNKIDSRAKSMTNQTTSSSKRAVTLDYENPTCHKKPRLPTQVKAEPEDVANQPAPSATPVTIYIRPCQMVEKRRDARERRARAAAEEEAQLLLRRERQLNAEQFTIPRESASR